MIQACLSAGSASVSVHLMSPSVQILNLSVHVLHSVSESVLSSVGTPFDRCVRVCVWSFVIIGLLDCLSVCLSHSFSQSHTFCLSVSVPLSIESRSFCLCTCGSLFLCVFICLAPSFLLRLLPACPSFFLFVCPSVGLPPLPSIHAEPQLKLFSSNSNRLAG